MAKALTITEKIRWPINFTFLFYNFKLLISNTSLGEVFLVCKILEKPAKIWED
jgi:hypothetical protein